MKDLNFYNENLFSSLQKPILNDGSVDVTPRYRDIHFLITKKALDALDPSALTKFLEPLSKSSDDNSIQLSDDELFQIVQSRYVQQPSDVQLFASYLEDAAKDIKSKYTDYETRKKNWDNFVTSLQRGKSDDTNPPSSSVGSSAT